MLTIYHNPRCSKSREALALLEAGGTPHQVRLYLAEPLDREELRALLQKLGLKASDVLRRSEPHFRETLKSRTLTEDELLDELVAHPSLIERPIVASETAAVIARPAEKLRDLR